MPTGYTADVKDGNVTTFPVFAMKCARAFGALITMRDDDMDASIPNEFKPDTYHRDALGKARAALKTANAITPAAAERGALADYHDAMITWEAGVARNAIERTRYEAMLAEARAWTPPSVDHRELKKFMVDQLTESIKFDCDHDHEAWKPKLLDADAWKAKQIERATRDVEYHDKGWRDEQARTAGRTEWVRQLRDSLTAVHGR